MRFILIKKDGKMDDINTNLNKKNIITTLNKYNELDLKLVYKWNYDSSEIHCFSCYEGEAGFENKHDLPPFGKSDFLESDSSEQLLFGNIFILKMINGKYVNFEISEYGEFYNIAFGGFDDCDNDCDNDSENSIELIENSDDENFIVNDGDINDLEEDEEWNKSDEEYISSDDNEDSELDEDTNDY